MATECPEPALTHDGAPTGATVNQAAPTGISDALSLLVEADPKAFIDMVHVVSGLRVMGDVTRDQLAAEYVRATNKFPTVLVNFLCNLWASSCKEMKSERAAEILLNRMYGTPRQTINMTSEVRTVSAEPMSLEDWSAKALDVKALPAAPGRPQ